MSSAHADGEQDSDEDDGGRAEHDHQRRHQPPLGDHHAVTTGCTQQTGHQCVQESVRTELPAEI